MDKILAAFTVKALYEAKNVWLQLKSYGKTFEDLDRYLKDYAARKKQQNDEFERYQEKWFSNALRCPKCAVTMILYPVNTNSGDQIEGNYKSQWYCRICDESIFSEDTVGQETERLGLR